MEQVSCSNCGGGRLSPIDDRRFECEYCGTMFFIETDEGGNLIDVDIDGVNQSSWQVFAIHRKLDVDGVSNNITVLQSASDARHIRNLSISGVGNSATVVMLDGAGCDVSGVGNTVARR